MRDHYFEGRPTSELSLDEVRVTLAAALDGTIDWSEYIGTEPREAIIERLKIELVIRSLGLNT